MEPVTLKRFALRDATITKLALCKSGTAANQHRVFLLKSDEDLDGVPRELPVAAVAQLVKAADDWSVAYVPVAVPGAEEKPGILGDPDSVDVWESEEEIAKAAHSFLENGGMVVGKHFDSDPAPGVRVVENAVALADFKVGDTVIAKGTWYVGLKFDEELRGLVAKGEIDGVSIEGGAIRIAKYDPAKTGMALPDLERKPGKQNWVDRVGGFPKSNWIYRTAKHLHYEKGMTIGHAIAVAVNAAKKLCATGDLNYKGVQNADPRGRADACKGVAEWEAMKARSGVAKSDAGDPATDDGLDLDGVDDPATIVEAEAVLDYAASADTRLLDRLAKAIGLDVDDGADYDELAKREFSTDERKRLAQQSKAMSDGSYPIVNASDLENAISAFGRAPSEKRDAVKRHIIKRARDLGVVGKLPDDWQVAKGLLDQGGNVPGMEVAERVEELAKTVEKQGEQLEELAKLGGDDGEIAKLTSSIEAIAKRLPEKDEEEEAPSASELSEKLDKLAESVGDQIEEIAKSVDQLAEGEASDTDTPGKTPVAKTNGESRATDGILFD